MTITLGGGNPTLPAVLPDTAWSWWTRPRAVSAGGICYVGGTDNRGRVTIDEYTSLTAVRRRTVLATLTEVDDHNNPAIIMREGQPVVAFWCRHNQDDFVRFARSTQPYVAGAALTFGAEQSIAFPGRTTYNQAFVHGTRMWTWARCADTLGWGCSYSDDWGVTWSAAVQVSTHARKHYMAIQLVGNKFRCAFSTHPVDNSPPDQNVYYAEIDAITGAITASAATLGNVLTGASLPVNINTMELVSAPAASGEVTWVFDVSDAPVPEVAWMSFADANQPATATYRYSVRGEFGWQSASIVAAGKRFANNPQVRYFGGVQFPNNSPGQRVITSRFDNPDWKIDRMTSTDLGATWAAETVIQSRDIVVRAWEVEKVDAIAAPFDIAAHFASVFTNQGLWRNSSTGGGFMRAPG